MFIIYNAQNEVFVHCISLSRSVVRPSLCLSLPLSVSISLSLPSRRKHGGGIITCTPTQAGWGLHLLNYVTIPSCEITFPLSVYETLTLSKNLAN